MGLSGSTGIELYGNQPSALTISYLEISIKLEREASLDNVPVIFEQFSVIIPGVT